MEIPGLTVTQSGKRNCIKYNVNLPHTKQNHHWNSSCSFCWKLLVSPVSYLNKLPSLAVHLELCDAPHVQSSSGNKSPGADKGRDNRNQGKPLVELLWVSSAWAQSSSCINHEQCQRRIQSCDEVVQQGTGKQVTHAALHRFNCWKETKVQNLQAPLTKIWSNSNSGDTSICQHMWKTLAKCRNLIFPSQKLTLGTTFKTLRHHWRALLVTN